MLAFHVETLENFKDDLQDIQSSLSVYSSDLTHLDAFAAGVGYARLNFKAEIFLKLLSEVNKTKIEDKDKLDIIQNVMIGKIGIIKPMLKAVKRESIVFPKRRVPVECLQKSKKDVKSWVEKIQDLEKSEMLAKKLHDELNQSPSVKCELCGLEIPESQYQLLDNCSHMFHSSCFTLNLQNQILARKTPMMCPGKGCVKEVGMTDLRHYLDKPWYEKYGQISIENYISEHKDTIKKCFNPKCSSLIEVPEGISRLICSLCRTEWCLSCNCEYHQGMNCEQYQESIKETPKDKLIKNVKHVVQLGKQKTGKLVKLEEAKSKAQIKSCPYCHTLIAYKISGPIKCNCGMVFT